MRIYNATRFLFPRSYRLRVFAICFGSVHVPLITFLVGQGLRGEWEWSTFAALLIATLVGTIVAVIGLAGLLAPIELAMARLAQLQAGEPVDECPDGGPRWRPAACDGRSGPIRQPADRSPQGGRVDRHAHRPRQSPRVPRIVAGQHAAW